MSNPPTQFSCFAKRVNNAAAFSDILPHPKYPPGRENLTLSYVRKDLDRRRKNNKLIKELINDAAVWMKNLKQTESTN